MIKWLNRKTKTVILSVIFSVVGFTAFINTAYAADIVGDLLLSWNLAGIISPTQLSGVSPLPSGLTTEQIGIITNSIKTNQQVVYALDGIPGAVTSLGVRALSLDYATALAAKNSAQDVYDSLAIASPPKPAELAAALIALNDAKAVLATVTLSFNNAVKNLRDAIITARDGLQGQIDQFLTVTARNQFAQSTIASTASTQAQAGNAITAQQNIDQQNQAQTGSNAQIGDAKIAQQNAAKFLDSAAGDPLATRMQSACSFIPMDLIPCIAAFTYYVPYKIASAALWGSGLIFDKMLFLSIDNSANMVVPDFIQSSWTVVRDFSNMLFIFVLLYTGIMTMFGQTDWRKVVLQVVVVALLVNFSLFFTKVIIDAGNILAVGVKSGITANTSISEGLVEAFQPQKFLFDSATTTAGNAIIVFLIATIVSGFAAWIFFKAALLFIGRLIAFWFLMIVSPFAFVSMTLPKGNKFQDWLDTLIGQAFVAPVFLFLIYLIMTVIQANGGIASAFPSVGTGWFESLLSPIIIATIIIIALQKALGIAGDMSGSFGKLGSDMAGKAMGLTAAVATGGAVGLAAGAGIAGRRFIGGAAAKELASGKPLTDERRATLEARTRSSYDFRNIGLDKGGTLGKIKSGELFKKDYGVGGVEKVAKTQLEKQTKGAEKSKLSIFEEEGIRSRVKETKKENEDKLIEAEKNLASIETTLADAIRENTEAQNAVDESPAFKELQKAREDLLKAQGEADRMPHSDSAKAVLRDALAAKDSAELKHTSSSESINLTETITKIEGIKKAQAEAVTKVAAAKKTAGLTEAEAVNAKIKERNKASTEAYAAKLAKEGRHAAAEAVRKKNKEKTPEEKFLEDLKKMSKKQEDIVDKKQGESSEKSEEKH